MFDMIKKLQEAKRAMEEMKSRLGNIVVEGKSSEQNVSVTMDGNRVVRQITISDDLLLSKPALEIQLKEAVNAALSQVEKLNEAEMKNAAGHLMPGMGGLFK